MSGGDHNNETRKTGVPLLDGAEWVDPDKPGPDCGCAGCYLMRDSAERKARGEVSS